MKRKDISGQHPLGKRRKLRRNIKRPMRAGAKARERRSYKARKLRRAFGKR